MDDGLPPLREVIARTGLTAQKGLGQNFLFDLNLTSRIARAAAPLEGFSIIEVGPGPGGLTRALLHEGATHVIAVERDPRALAALEEVGARWPGRLSTIIGDALAVNWPETVQGPAKVVANLPYNIATPLLVGWLAAEPWPPWFASLTLMFQKEVAERIAAPVGSGDYGRLSVLCQYRCTVRKLFDVNRSAFTPPPKVTSSLVQLLPRQRPEPEVLLPHLQKVTAAAFGQRRKMLRSSLKTIADDPEALLAMAGVDPRQRAEEVPVAGFALLAKSLKDLSSDHGQTG